MEARASSDDRWIVGGGSPTADSARGSGFSRSVADRSTCLPSWSEAEASWNGWSGSHRLQAGVTPGGTSRWKGGGAETRAHHLKCVGLRVGIEAVQARCIRALRERLGVGIIEDERARRVADRDCNAKLPLGPRHVGRVRWAGPDASRRGMGHRPRLHRARRPRHGRAWTKFEEFDLWLVGACPEPRPQKRSPRSFRVRPN